MQNGSETAVKRRPVGGGVWILCGIKCFFLASSRIGMNET